MLAKTIKLSDLQLQLDAKFGKGAWLDFEPETILMEFNCPEYMVMEKVYILQALNKAMNSVMSLPEFVLWTTSLANNQPAEFETISMPSSLELAWMIDEVKKISIMIGVQFIPSEELGEIVGYLLRQEGFSKPVPPFEFVPERLLHPGQTEADTQMKTKAISAYIREMRMSNA